MPQTSVHERPSVGRIIRRVLLAGLLLLILLIAGARWNLRRQVKAAIEEVRATGVPVTLVELQQRHRDLEGRTDGSAAMLDLLDQVAATDRRLETNGIPGTTVKANTLPIVGSGAKLPADGAIDPGLTNAVQLALTEIGPALVELGEITGRSGYVFRFPIDLTEGFSVLLPHLSRLKSVAQWYDLQSAWAIERGDTGAAVDAIVNSLSLSRTLEGEPFIISQLVRFAMLQIAVTSAERILSHESLSQSDLRRLMEALQTARPEAAIHEAMIGERCAGLDFMHFRPGNLATLESGPSSGPSSTMSSVPLLLYRMSGLADRDVLYYLDAMNVAVAAGTNAVSSRVTVADGSFNAPQRNRFALFSNMLLPALGKAYQKEADCLTALAAVETALAVESFRAAHQGQLPSSLAELVPDYFVQVPLDPATGRPLSLEPAAVGYVIQGTGPLITVRR